MKVKNILELVGDKFTVVNINDKIYNFKGLFCYYKISKAKNYICIYVYIWL